jgi:hypothetical protein
MTSPGARILLVAAALAAGAITAEAQVSADSTKRMNIRRLLILQQTDSMMIIGMEQGMPADAPADPSLPTGFRDALLTRARKDVGEFLEMMVPLYDSLYTADEVRQLIVFHESPIGRRVVQQQPRLVASLGELGRQWGMELAGKVLQDLSRRRN